MDITGEIREGFIQGYMTPGVTREQAEAAWARSVPKVGLPIRVAVTDGMPHCPHCGMPLRSRGDGQWDCPTARPIWEEAARLAGELFDRVLV